LALSLWAMRLLVWCEWGWVRKRGLSRLRYGGLGGGWSWGGRWGGGWALAFGWVGCLEGFGGGGVGRGGCWLGAPGVGGAVGGGLGGVGVGGGGVGGVLGAVVGLWVLGVGVWGGVGVLLWGFGCQVRFSVTEQAVTSCFFSLFLGLFCRFLFLRKALLLNGFYLVRVFARVFGGGVFYFWPSTCLLWARLPSRTSEVPLGPAPPGFLVFRRLFHAFWEFPSPLPPPFQD